MSYVKKMTRKSSRLRFEFLSKEMHPVDLPPIHSPKLLSKTTSPEQSPKRKPIVSRSERISSATNQSRSLDVSEKLNFYENYKTYYTGHRHCLNKSIQQTSDLYYIEALEKKRIMPGTIGFVRSNQNQLWLKDWSMGDKYATALASGIYTQRGHLELLDVRANRLRDIGASKLTKNLDPAVIQEINMASNNLGPKAIEKIKTVLFKSTTLKELNLSRWNLNSRTVSLLFDGVSGSKSLKKLDVSHNKIADQACASISNMLKLNINLTHLDLQYNNIRGTVGGFQIFKGLKENNTLLDLNLAWNSLGNQKQSCAEIFGSALESNESLKHLDISFNKFNTKEIGWLGRRLKANKTILGIHVEGNQAYYDGKGNLIPKETRMRPETVLGSSRQMGLRTNCWICENWGQISVEFSPSEIGWSGKFLEKIALRNKKVEPVFLHMEIDNWEPCFMPRNDETGKYELTRAVPQEKGKIPKFFISYRGQSKLSDNYEIAEIDEPINKEMEITKDRKSQIKLVVAQTTKLGEGSAGDILQDFDPLPRFDAQFEKPEFEIEEIQEWSIENSMFKNMIVSNEMYDKCFQRDVMDSRIQGMISNVKIRENIKKDLRTYYPAILETYKHFASKTHKDSQVFLSYNDVWDFLLEIDVVDNKTFSKHDYDPIFRAVNFSDAEEPLNPDHGVVRYEFLETLVRVAIEKFKVKGSCKTEDEAVKQLICEILSPKMEEWDQGRWRSTRYLTENMEIVFRTYMPVFQQLYDKYKEQNVVGEKAFLDQDGFYQLCCDLQLIDSKRTGKKKSYKYYHRSMQPQVDEISNARHLKMSFMEFLEAFSRAIDKTDDLPIMHKNNDHWYILENDFTTSKWLLDMKIEGMLPNIIQLINFRADSDTPIKFNRTAHKKTQLRQSNYNNIIKNVL